MAASITTITTEDGAIIGIGDVAYDYYGMGVVTLSSIDPNGQLHCCNCPVHDGPDHDTDARDNYWGDWAPVAGFGGRHPWGGTLDGSRVASLAWAARKGWPGANDYSGPAPTGWPSWKLPR